MEKAKAILQGLSGEEAKKRLTRFGKNELKGKKRVSWLKVLLEQFKSPLIYILVMASGVTLALGDVTDAIVIGAAVILNTILGFYQEMKAERSLEALSEMLTPKAKVIREGKREMIEASEVVPGEVCILELGERVPADGVVVEAESLSVNEAILTGESEAVEKLRCSDGCLAKLESWVMGTGEEKEEIPKEVKVFMGTTVSGGIGKMVVVKTGQETEVGKIAEKLTETVEEKTPLQKQIGIFSGKLAIMVGVVSLVIVAVGLMVGDPFVEIFTTAVAVAVSAIPEGLAVSLTVILAIGMQRIFKRKALVRKLVAAETLGSVTVICADKTGTLTEGKMRVVKVLESINPEAEVRKMKLDWLIKAAVLCNDMRDPLEIGMAEWAIQQKLGDKAVKTEEIEKELPRLAEIPFDPKWRYIATLHQGGGKKYLLVSGAPEEVLMRCKTTEERRKQWHKSFEEEAGKGRRLVGFAFKELEGKKTIENKDVAELRWLGSLVYEDPIREGVKEALAAARQAGIKVKVITGDYRVTAEAVLKQLDLWEEGDEVVEGKELKKLSVEDLKERIDKVRLFARTDPEQKLRIVKALQRKGEVVAMTGDGVNDAPAVKKADIGIVVESASAVAKETADMVLMDSNFATIVAAVEEGRGIFVNLRKIILYLLSDAFAEVVLVLGSMVLGLPLPITAAQILWVNLADDGLPDFALTLEPKPSDLMTNKPQGHERSLLDVEIKWLIGLISGITGLLALGVFWWYLGHTGDLVLARTLAFTMLGVDSLLYVFSCKSLKEPLWREKWWDNKWLLAAVAAGLTFQIMALYVPGLQELLKTEPLRMKEWLIVLAGSVAVIGLIEGVKWRFNHLIKKEK